MAFEVLIATICLNLCYTWKNAICLSSSLGSSCKNVLKFPKMYKNELIHYAKDIFIWWRLKKNDKFCLVGFKVWFKRFKLENVTYYEQNLALALIFVLELIYVIDWSSELLWLFIEIKSFMDFNICWKAASEETEINLYKDTSKVFGGCVQNCALCWCQS